MTQTIHEQSSDALSLAEITERLFTRFDATVPLSVIIKTVRQARADLAGSPAAALPELVERLAHYRISQSMPPRGR